MNRFMMLVVLVLLVLASAVGLRNVATASSSRTTVASTSLPVPVMPDLAASTSLPVPVMPDAR
ncbi:MAG TPA: hypothetical protein VGU63_04410 [Candidatus Acidoferrales bacterium]|nr:hypothetical protein [Candidatus Acidoferrales bacterium]